MLTRLKISGFKNLMDTDIRFGPFTCIAGANGVGKSNLFDAIRFLSALADMPFIEAALLVRDEEGRTADIRHLFHRIGNTYAEKMCFEAEMIIPATGQDHLGQTAKATTTLLRYSVELTYRKGDNSKISEGLELLKEELVHIKKGDAAKHLLFKHSAANWRESLGLGKRSGAPFISTELNEENKRLIKLHQDGGSSGKPRSLPATHLPRTVLSDTNASESPTAVLARQEMRSWRLLQLEPTALRKPDEFAAPNRLGMDGAHLAKTLYYLANTHTSKDGKDAAEQQIYAQVTNRLAQLLEDVQEVKVDRDEKRELLTLQVAGKDKTFHPARSLSDGTLRFLALAVLELDRQAGVLCFEEPENGIHPQRIEAMLELLQDIAVDTDEPVNEDNPLRQVIINTHSPSVVSLVPAESLVVAEPKESVDAKSRQRFKHVGFSCLNGTWRGKASDLPMTVSLGTVLAYLNPTNNLEKSPHNKSKRVKDHLTDQLALEFPE